MRRGGEKLTKPTPLNTTLNTLISHFVIAHPNLPDYTQLYNQPTAIFWVSFHDMVEESPHPTCYMR